MATPDAANLAPPPDPAVRSLWTPAGRSLVFALSATSIWCLLAGFYGLMSMRAFTLFVFLPASLVLIVLAVVDHRRRGSDRRLARAVAIGATAGFFAAVAYDVFRLPFVFARAWGLDGWLPALNLFKVFPRFGAMILGQPLEQPTYSLAAHLIGWAYHFSNGMTFGIMFIALVGAATRRTWVWAVAFAVGLELAMLGSPYATVFTIALTATFVAVTLLAHLIFGVCLGLFAWQHERAWPPRPAKTPAPAPAP